MMYLLTPEEHAKTVDVLDTIEALFTSMDIQHLLAYREVKASLAMLKAMKPASPVAFAAFVDNGNIRLWSANAQDAVKAPHLKPLYAKEQQ